MVFISGIGCSSRFPYYMNTYGFHSIHGRAPAFATGLKVARPDLTVWVVTGDGDGLSIGGNHLHPRHPPQHRPEDRPVQQRDLRSDQGPVFADLAARHQDASRRRGGSFDRPLRPLSLALGAEATFVARTIDVDIKHLTETLRRAAAHKGTAFVEVYQNCVIFNDDVFEYASDKSVKADNMVYLEHGKPMIFGKDRDKGIRLNGLDLEVVQLGDGDHGEGPAGPRRIGRGADAGRAAEPDGLPGDAGVPGRAALRGTADVRRAAPRTERQRGQGEGPRQARRPVRQR